MLIYITVLLSFPLCSLLFRSLHLNSDTCKKLIFSIIFVELCTVAMLRAETVGTDLPGYIDVFKYISTVNWSGIHQISFFEPGYIWFTKILSFISEDSRFFIVSISLFILVGFAYFIWERSKCIGFSFFLLVALGFYTSSFYILRQYIAIVILLNSICFVEQRKFIRFVVCVFLAATFHFTSIVFLLLYPIAGIKISWKYFITVLISLLLFGGILIPIILNQIISSFYSNYDTYISLGNEGYGMFLMIFLFVLFCFIVRDRMPPQDRQDNNIFFHMLIIACCLQTVSFYFPLFVRLVLFFWIAVIVLIPNVIYSIRNAKLRLLSLTVFYLTIFSYFYFFILAENGTSDILPYKFMWE